MTDSLTEDRRSWNMSRVRSDNTKPELIVRSLLHRCGFRFSLRRRELPGSPDIVMRKYRTVIFVHGCFWHRHEGCRQSSTPQTRSTFWNEKFRRNMARDKENQERLRLDRWRVIVLWECNVLRDPQSAVKRIISEIAPDRLYSARLDELPTRKEALRVAESKVQYRLNRKPKAQH